MLPAFGWQGSQFGCRRAAVCASLAIAPGDLVRIDIETCSACGGAVRTNACIEDPDIIEKILTHLDAKGAESQAARRPPGRAPPQRGLFD